MSVDKLTFRDLLLDKKLEDISKHSLPSKEEQDEPSTILSNTVVSNINLRDVGIEEQLQKISRNTIKDVFGWKPTPIKSHVTQEMIQEYQDELERNVYDDPITGKKFKYAPANTDFTLEEPDLQATLDETTLNQDLAQLATQYKQMEKAIRIAYDSIQFIRNSEVIQGRDSKKLLGEFAEFMEPPEILKLRERIELLKSGLVNIQAQMDYLEYIKTNNRVILSENQAEIDRVRKSNRQLLKEKSDEMNLLNMGKMNIQQQPNESDEDFKQRLINVGQVEFDETSVQQSAERRTLHKFKENMKELTRNNMLVEQIIKMVTPQRLFEYNKFFSILSTKFKEVYGRAKLTEDNARELVQFFNGLIGKQVTEDLLTPVQAPVQAPLLEDFGLPPLPVLAPLPISSPVTPISAPVTPRTPVPYNPYKMTKQQLIDEFKERYGNERGKLLTSNLSNGVPPNRSDIIARLLDRGIIQGEDSYEQIVQQRRVGRPIGSGFLEELPKFAGFGKIAINPRALYYDNDLIVMKHNKHHINGYNKVKVSDHFVNAIMKLLKHEIPKHEDLKHFDLKEKELYDMVIHLAGLHKRVEHNLDRTKQSMKHRFELLDGELNAGNNNREIKKELKDLVHKMAYAGMISHHEAHQYLYPNMRKKSKK